MFGVCAHKSGAVLEENGKRIQEREIERERERERGRRDRKDGERDGEGGAEKGGRGINGGKIRRKKREMIFVFNNNIN